MSNPLSPKIAFAFLCLLAAQAHGQSGAAGEKWGAHIDIEAKPGSKRTLGEADLFLPLRQDARSLVFANLRMRVADHGNLEGNLGLGWRRMQESGWNLGVYGYLDRRRTNNGNYFHQTTLGAEALGRDWDFRANGYLPIGTRAHALAPENTAALSGTTVQVTTAFREERALKGFDAEIGWRAPLFDSEAARQLRLYVGGYHFADAGVTVQGPRLRAEFTLDELPWLGQGTGLFLGAETQHDNARGSQSFVSLRLRIPLGKTEGRATRLSMQERRMTAPVVRDVDIVTQARTSSTLVETATATASGQTITVLSSATTAGNDLDTAVAGAANNSTIVLSGAFNVSGGNEVVVDNGKILKAGSTTVRTASGREAVLTTSATVTGTNITGTATIRLANNATLEGMTITGIYNNGSGGRAVHLDTGAGNITVRNNTITVSQSGANAAVALGLGGTNANILVSGNTLTATGSGAATTMTALAANIGTNTVTVSGNTLIASGGTTNNMAWVAGATTINAGSTGNVRGSGACNGVTASGSIGFTNGTTCP